MQRVRSRVSAWLDAPCCQLCCSREQPWYSLKELLQLQYPRNREVLPGARESFGLCPPPSQGAWNPLQMEDQSLGLRLTPATWHQMHGMMGTRGCLCFTAAKHKESPPKSPQSWPEVSWKQGMESPGGRRRRRCQHEELRWLLGQLWLRLAMPWEVPPGWALLDLVSMPWAWRRIMGTLKCWVQVRLPGAEPGLAESQQSKDLPSPEKKATITESSHSSSKVQPEPTEQRKFSGRTQIFDAGSN